MDNEEKNQQNTNLVTNKELRKIYRMSKKLGLDDFDDLSLFYSKKKRGSSVGVSNKTKQVENSSPLPKKKKRPKKKETLSKKSTEHFENSQDDKIFNIGRTPSPREHEQTFSSDSNEVSPLKSNESLDSGNNSQIDNPNNSEKCLEDPSGSNSTQKVKPKIKTKKNQKTSKKKIFEIKKSSEVDSEKKACVIVRKISEKTIGFINKNLTLFFQKTFKETSVKSNLEGVSFQTSSNYFSTVTSEAQAPISFFPILITDLDDSEQSMFFTLPTTEHPQNKSIPRLESKTEDQEGDSRETHSPVFYFDISETLVKLKNFQREALLLVVIEREPKNNERVFEFCSATSSLLEEDSKEALGNIVSFCLKNDFNLLSYNRHMKEFSTNNDKKIRKYAILDFNFFSSRAEDEGFRETYKHENIRTLGNAEKGVILVDFKSFHSEDFDHKEFCEAIRASLCEMEKEDIDIQLPKNNFLRNDLLSFCLLYYNYNKFSSEPVNDELQDRSGSPDKNRKRLKKVKLSEKEEAPREPKDDGEKSNKETPNDKNTPKTLKITKGPEKKAQKSKVETKKTKKIDEPGEKAIIIPLKKSPLDLKDKNNCVSAPNLKKKEVEKTSTKKVISLIKSLKEKINYSIRKQENKDLIDCNYCHEAIKARRILFSDINDKKKSRGKKKEKESIEQEACFICFKVWHSDCLEKLQERKKNFLEKVLDKEVINQCKELLKKYIHSLKGFNHLDGLEKKGTRIALLEKCLVDECLLSYLLNEEPILVHGNDLQLRKGVIICSDCVIDNNKGLVRKQAESFFYLNRSFELRVGGSFVKPKQSLLRIIQFFEVHQQSENVYQTESLSNPRLNTIKFINIKKEIEDYCCVCFKLLKTPNFSDYSSDNQGSCPKEIKDISRCSCGNHFHTSCLYYLEQLKDSVCILCFFSNIIIPNILEDFSDKKTSTNNRLTDSKKQKAQGGDEENFETLFRKVFGFPNILLVLNYFEPQELPDENMFIYRFKLLLQYLKIFYNFVDLFQQISKYQNLLPGSWLNYGSVFYPNTDGNHKRNAYSENNYNPHNSEDKPKEIKKLNFSPICRICSSEVDAHENGNEYIDDSSQTKVFDFLNEAFSYTPLLDPSLSIIKKHLNKKIYASHFRCFYCGEFYHPFCINISLSVLNINNRWACPECAVCVVCSREENEDLLVACESCDKYYHIYCHSPRLDEVPNSSFRCLDCLNCACCGTKLADEEYLKKVIKKNQAQERIEPENNSFMKLRNRSCIYNFLAKAESFLKENSREPILFLFQTILFREKEHSSTNQRNNSDSPKSLEKRVCLSCSKEVEICGACGERIAEGTNRFSLFSDSQGKVNCSMCNCSFHSSCENRSPCLTCRAENLLEKLIKSLYDQIKDNNERKNGQQDGKMLRLVQDDTSINLALFKKVLKANFEDTNEPYSVSNESVQPVLGDSMNEKNYKKFLNSSYFELKKRNEKLFQSFLLSFLSGKQMKVNIDPLLTFMRVHIVGSLVLKAFKTSVLKLPKEILFYLKYQNSKNLNAEGLKIHKSDQVEPLINYVDAPDEEVCCICSCKVKDSLLAFTEDRLIPISYFNKKAHINCLIWTCGLDTKGNINYDILKNLEALKENTCYFCRKSNATIKCGGNLDSSIPNRPGVHSSYSTNKALNVPSKFPVLIEKVKRKENIAPLEAFQSLKTTPSNIKNYGTQPELEKIPSNYIKIRRTSKEVFTLNDIASNATTAISNSLKNNVPEPIENAQTIKSDDSGTNLTLLQSKENKIEESQQDLSKENAPKPVENSQKETQDRKASSHPAKNSTHKESLHSCNNFYHFYCALKYRIESHITSASNSSFCRIPVDFFKKTTYVLFSEIYKPSFSLLSDEKPLQLDPMKTIAQLEKFFEQKRFYMAAALSKKFSMPTGKQKSPEMHILDTWGKIFKVFSSLTEDRDPRYRRKSLFQALSTNYSSCLPVGKLVFSTDLVIKCNTSFSHNRASEAPNESQIEINFFSKIYRKIFTLKNYYLEALQILTHSPFDSKNLLTNPLRIGNLIILSIGQGKGVLYKKNVFVAHGFSSLKKVWLPRGGGNFRERIIGFHIEIRDCFIFRTIFKNENREWVNLTNQDIEKVFVETIEGLTYGIKQTEDLENWKNRSLFSKAFGLNAYHFFGIGLEEVQKAIRP